MKRAIGSILCTEWPELQMHERRDEVRNILLECGLSFILTVRDTNK